MINKLDVYKPNTVYSIDPKNGMIPQANCITYPWEGPGITITTKTFTTAT
jgi:hypothetical protein